MKIKNKKIRRIVHNMIHTVFKISVYFILLFLAVLAVCFVLSLPELIGMLIFG